VPYRADLPRTLMASPSWPRGRGSLITVPATL
jgi:hypothetical protein